MTEWQITVLFMLLGAAVGMLYSIAEKLHKICEILERRDG